MFQEFTRQAAGSLAIRILATLLGFVVSITIARLMGPSTLGTFSYAMVCVTLLATFANLGFNVLSVRELAAGREHERWGLIKGFVRFSTLLTVLLSLTVALFVHTLTPWMAPHLGPQVAEALPFVAVATPLFALIRLNQQFLRGLGHVLTSQLPIDVVRPLVFTMFLFSIVFWGYAGNDTDIVLGTQWAALFMALLFGYFLFRSRVPPQCRQHTGEYDPQYWTGAGLTFLAIELMQFLNHRTDILVLGLFVDTSTIGIYSVAQSVAGLATFPLIAGNLVIAPRLAQTHVRGSRGELNQLIGYGVGLVFFASLPIILVCALFTSPILSVWGGSFGVGVDPVRTLLVGQALNVFFANIALILNMTGYERTVFIGTSLGVVMNVVLNFLLIPSYGMKGAAAATVLSMAVWNGYLAHKVVSHLNVDPSPMNLLSRLGLLGKRRFPAG